MPREELYKLCDETKTSRTGIDFLVNFYINSLGWSEDEAIKYAIGLFHNGTIKEIKLLGLIDNGTIKEIKYKKGQ